RHVHPFADDLREYFQECFANITREGEMRFEMAFQVVVENAADAARNAAMRNPEIFVGPLGKAWIESGIVRCAGGTEPRMKRFGVFFVGYCGVEVGTAAEPALPRREEACIHVNGGHVRVGHVRDQADPGGEEARIVLGSRDALGELGAELASDGRYVDADLFENFSGHLAANSAATGFSGRVRSVPRGVCEGSIGAGLALDFFERRANAVAQ